MTAVVKDICMPFYLDEREFIPRELKRRGISCSSYKIARAAVDARKAPEVRFVYTVLCEISSGSLPTGEKAEIFEKEDYPASVPEASSFKSGYRPVVVGFGPCGIFCTLLLAEKGFRPIVLERGDDCKKRKTKAEAYFAGGALDTESNVQFGEGGAGAFSDGKLMTRISDKRCSFVMDTLVRFGAPGEISYLARPHVGTDRLSGIVENIRNEIIRLGGEVRFGARLDGMERTKNGTYALSAGGAVFETDAVFIASGHSAVDTVEMLRRFGADVRAKDFSLGFRIEHKRLDVERSVYKGAIFHEKAYKLPAAEYNVSYRKGAKGVYSFCMCPGGVVVPSESENGTIVTNGMSFFARDGENSNCAIAVSVNGSDHGGSVERALKIKTDMERAAFLLGNGKAPCQSAGSFIRGEKPYISDAIRPTYARKTHCADTAALFTHEQSALLREGLSYFGRSFEFFKDENAPITAPETRTSSPVRVMRSPETLVAVTSGGSELPGIYPCGEGAGYAGGITSAACDGLRCAEAYIFSKRRIFLTSGY